MDNTTNKTTTAGYTIEVKHWDGNVRPYRATVRFQGGYVGTTGATRSEGAAERAAAKIIARHRKG